MYIFLDESGDFTKHNHEEYFVIASFTVGNQRKTDKEFAKWTKSRFPKKIRGQSEIKWSTSNIDDNLRLRTLKAISKMDVRIRYGYLLRNNIPQTYRNKKNKINTGDLYTNIVGEVLEQYLPADENEIRIFCDRKSLKGMTKQEFESVIRSRLLIHCSPDTLVEVEMIDSSTNRNIQIVDWIAGAINRYHEKGKNGEEYFGVLRNNLLGEGKEFFKR